MDVYTDGSVQLSEVLAGLSYSLDLTEGQRPGHAVRTCLIGMRLGEALGLPDSDRSALFYALLMKDLGCSSNAARFAALFGASDHDLKRDIKDIDWSRAIESFRFVVRHVAPGQSTLRRVWHLVAVLACGPAGAREVVRTRCERGADIAGLLGLGPATVQANRGLDEHWDGHGQPYELRGENIPVLARILGLAQTVEVFFSQYGVATAYDMAAARRGRWFDPALVDVLFSFRSDTSFWSTLAGGEDLSALTALEPAAVTVDARRLDRVIEAFAQVIDAKSPWTYQHSTGVATAAVRIGRRLGCSDEDLQTLRRAALLHDIGKLGVSNRILDKPDRLSDVELVAMRRHPEFTAQILARVSCFHPWADLAASHHERLDGLGYHRARSGRELAMLTRVLTVADIYEALSSSRPYREGLPTERILEVLKRDVGTAIDGECFNALRCVLLESSVGTVSDVPAAAHIPALAEDYLQAA